MRLINATNDENVATKYCRYDNEIKISMCAAKGMSLKLNVVSVELFLVVGKGVNVLEVGKLARIMG